MVTVLVGRGEPAASAVAGRGLPKRQEAAPMSISLEEQQHRRDMLAQWAFDCRPVLGRFHLWLDEVETVWTKGRPSPESPCDMSFVLGAIERQLAMTAAVTALGTRLYGRFGEGAGQDKATLNQIKKEADAVSAYSLSEGLWYLTRHLPENHAIMVCLGEGLMPKAGETPEMGSNPNLGFGRVYARPGVARFIDALVVRLLNDAAYGWKDFYAEIQRAGITLWGAAIDTLENTSRFALGRQAGTMTILHVFDQPLHVVRPYEGYMGTLLLPKEVVDRAEESSVLIDYRTPRKLVLEAIQKTYPGIAAERVHVWTLAGASRKKRLEGLWDEWSTLGVHLVDEGWSLPAAEGALTREVFTESGTYSPTHAIGSWKDAKGDTHLFLVDGYAASAEAVAAATLASLKGIEASLAVFTSSFKLPYDKERHLMHLNPEASDFEERLAELYGEPVDGAKACHIKEMILEGLSAGIPLAKPVLCADDFFPEREWRVLALGSYMGPDPYSGLPGVEDLGEGRYRVTVRLTSKEVDKQVHLTLKMMKPVEDRRLVFLPLLQRFLQGEDYRQRAVKISDSGRIRNELQTLCSDALEFPSHDRMRLVFSKIPEAVFTADEACRLKNILSWYKEHHPVWFIWLELC